MSGTPVPGRDGTPVPGWDGTPEAERPGTPVPVAVALGSNLGRRRAHVTRAARGLSELLEGMRHSSLYESVPEEGGGAGLYLNACCVGRTELAPAELLGALQALEALAGRPASGGRRPGDRTLDLDLLLYGERVIERPGLVVPHPRMRRRPFVLLPLAEIAADWRDPGTGRSIGELVEGLGAVGGVRRIAGAAAWV